MKLEYPVWAQAFIAIMVLLPIAPILFFVFYYWPSNWRSSFYNMFCTGITNYLPDPSRGKRNECQITQLSQVETNDTATGKV